MDCDTIYKWCDETSCLQHEYSYLYPASLAMKVEFISVTNDIDVMINIHCYKELEFWPNSW